MNKTKTNKKIDNEKEISEKFYSKLRDLYYGSSINYQINIVSSHNPFKQYILLPENRIKELTLNISDINIFSLDNFLENGYNSTQLFHKISQSIKYYSVVFFKYNGIYYTIKSIYSKKDLKKYFPNKKIKDISELKIDKKNINYKSIFDNIIKSLNKHIKMAQQNKLGVFVSKFTKIKHKLLELNKYHTNIDTYLNFINEIRKIHFNMLSDIINNKINSYKFI